MSNPLDLGHQPPLVAAAHIAELGAASWWLKQIADGNIDPVASQGRIIPVVRTRNMAEQATVAVGQISIFHFVWIAIWHLLLAPLTAISMAICAAPVLGVAGATHSFPLAVLVSLVMVGVWLYVFMWKILLKGFVGWIWRRL